MRQTILSAGAILTLLAGIAAANELTMMIEKDLACLGYDTGAVDGEETMETVIAISKFQAENNLEVTGEATPQLAGILSSKAEGSSGVESPAMAAAQSSASEPMPAGTEQATLKAAQQACLQQKIAQTQAAQKKKRGFGRLINAITRTAAKVGNHDLARTTNDIYYAGATADDISAAARDLGLTEDDIQACQDPQ